jgi:ankyrin repeat protein
MIATSPLNPATTAQRLFSKSEDMEKAFIHLPDELLLLIASFLEKEKDISSLSRTCRKCYPPLNSFLYHHNSWNLGSSALLWAGQRGMEGTARICIRNGAHVGVTDIHDYDRTPLFWAACNGYEAVVKLLLETGRVNADSKDSRGETPLLAAAKHGHEAVVKLLLDTGRVDVNSKCAYETPLFRAAYYGHEAVVKLLLETGHVDLQPKDDPNGWTPLYFAAWHGYEAVVKHLLATEGVDADSKDSNGWTPLLRAAQEGHEAVVECLLETGHVQPEEGPGGWTPLSVATQNGHEAVVELLQWSEWRSFWNRAG